MSAPECPRCHGAGVIDVYDNGHYWGTAQCPRCNGTGVAR